MIPTKTTLLYAGIALVSLAAGIFSAQWLGGGDSTTPPTPASTAIGVPEHRLDFTLQDLNDQPRQLSEWDGKVVLLNFWATWCPPCRKEMPDFIELREEIGEQGFEVIGVALDRAGPVQNFIDEIGVEYPILLAEQEGITIMLRYGNQLATLPYSVIIDQSGQVVEAFRKEVNKQQLLTIIKPLLEQTASQRTATIQ